eukprot:GFUD01002103.1.p1 GENE.GFUD01002103.1~~GFUD01002103.1.p1  ORF type:complete len:1505 (+),score=292.95 GFUD01002103.1:136-4515(+)
MWVGKEEMIEGTEERVWQGRCMELEDSLARFRDQAHRIREILKEKLSELESRVVDAESRAENAEHQVRLMERRLGEVEWSPTEQSVKADEYQKAAFEKEKVIKTLEGEVESQRQQRLSDAKQVEAKAARIKDWVTNKLRELEEQNQHLREQNAYCNEQMELLRNRLEQLQELGQTCSKTSSRRESTAEDSSLGSFEGEPGMSNESLSDIGGITDSKLKTRKGARQRPLTSLESSGHGNSSLYAQIDPKKKRRPPSAYLSRSTGRTKSVDPVTMTTSLTGLEELTRRKMTNNIRDSRVDSGSVDLETPLELSPKSPLEALDDALNAVMPNLGTLHNQQPSCIPQPTPPPRHKIATRQGKEEPSKRHSIASPKLDKQSHMPLARLKKKGPLMSNESHDYSEIYTPSKEQTSWDHEMTSVTASGPESMSGSSSVRTGSGDSGLSGGNSTVQAPPPPIHKYPSWEDRIYQVASDGIKTSSSDIVIGAQIESRNNNNLPHGQLASGGYGTDINVPVYATVKGRASQIRSMPFTGDSSDSSDGEELPDARDTSFESDVSNDYAIPPDASIDSLAPPVSHRASYLESPRKGAEKALEKSGYLTKLGGKIKSWHKRYFVLKTGVLSYWKSQHDLHRKPQGIIVLNESCRVSRADGSNTFEIATGTKNYYLTADSQPIMEEWVRVLQNVVQRNALRLLLSREDQKPTLQAWLIKVKHGHSRKCWCVLIGKMFIYFRTPNEQNPMGQVNMRDTRVEEVEHISDSDSDEISQNVEKAMPEPTIGIFPNHVHQGPTYLIFPNRAEQEKWLYQLTVVSGGDPKAGTQCEQLVQKLMEVDGDPSSMIWRHPLMTYSKEPISLPLTTFTSETLQAEAIKLFKSVQLFMSVVLDSSGIDYHVVLAQNAIQLCLDIPELQPELLSALIKQTSRHTQARHGVQVRNSSSFKHPRSFLMNATNLFSCDSSSTAKTSPQSVNPPLIQSDSKANPPNTVFIQGWMLLAIAVSIFVPKNSKLLWFLRTHFNRNKDSKTETGKYASYCANALEKCVVNGPRTAKPSRMEVLSILLKNPHHHSLPHAVPVHMLNGTYHVVGFDGSTTIAEFLQTLNLDIGCRGIELSGFTIFSDDPIEKNMDHCLSQKDKVCDVISRWETALREKGSGKFENKRVIRFTYKNRMFWRRSTPGETEKERLLFCYQISHQIVEGRFPLNKELAFELSALMAQIDIGDLSSDKGRCSSAGSNILSEALDKFYPVRYQESASQEEKDQLELSLADKWRGLAGKSVTDCVRILLTCTRKWQFFGATLFEVRANDDSKDIWFAINEDGVSLLDHTTMQVSERYPYPAIVTFGGCQEDFMLVVTSPDRQSTDSITTQKLLFETSKPKILEITLLIADYMNMMGQLLPLTQKSTTASRVHSRSVSRSRLTASNLTVVNSAPNTPRLNPKDEKSSLVRSGSTSSSTDKRSQHKRQQLDSGVA